MASRLANNISSTFITRLALIAIGVVGSIITARYLGADGKGVLATLTIITGTVVQFGNFGLHASNTYFIARQRERTPQILSNALLTGVIGGGLLMILTYLGIQIFPRALGSIPQSYVIISLLIIPASFLILFFQNALIALGRVKYYNLLELAMALLGLVAVIAIFYIFHFHLRAVVIMTVATSIIAAGGYLWSMRTEIRWPFRFDVSLFRDMFAYGYKSYLASLFSFFIIRSDILLLNYFRGTTETGVYSIAVQFADLLYLLPVTSGAMLFPAVASTVSNSDKTVTTQTLSRFIALIMLGLCLISAIMVYPILSILYGQAFIGATTPFLILLPGIFCLSLNTILMNDFGGRGLPPVAVYTPAIGLTVNVIINLFLVPRYGMNAAAMTSSLAYVLMFLIAGSAFVRMTSSRWRDLVIPRRDDIQHIIQLLPGRKKTVFPS